VSDDQVLGWLFFWGIWLLIPVILDGVHTVAQLLVVGGGTLRRRAWQRREGQVGAARSAEETGITHWPYLSVLLPVRNGEAGLARCLDALVAQEYPGPFEVLVIDNASTDRTRALAYTAGARAPFPLHVVALDHAGKTRALNAGIALARGELIVHIDADTALLPDALTAVARQFLADPTLGAASGSVEIRPVEPGVSRGLALLGYCEFLEYLATFRLGRQYQAATDSLYTLSGAFSCFRREALLSTFLYSDGTVSEDMMLTFDLHYGRPGAKARGRQWRLGFIADARASLDPIPSLAALYAQRVRWQRGQLEVSAAYAETLYRGVLRIRGLAPGRALLADHTLLFPRLIWTALLPVLLTFGYPADLVLGATLAMYGFYLLGELASIATCYWLGDRTIRRRIRAGLLFLPLLPLYRYGVSLCRLGGILEACAEPPAWRSQDPWTQTRAHARAVRLQLSSYAHLLAERLREGRSGRGKPEPRGRRDTSPTPSPTDRPPRRAPHDLPFPPADGAAVPRPADSLMHVKPQLREGMHEPSRRDRG
jgi:biofilm PGA synthesis N-glycosyltransferase PgaC